jgi:mannose-6-phosphate isomerase-like protein (cupin superfamily)
MPRPIRRVVTGHSAQGRAIFISDGPAPAVYDRGSGATAVTELWETSATPASNAGNADPTAGQTQQRLPPPKNGSKFRVVEYPPDSKRVAALHATSSAQNANAKSEGYARDVANKRHPGFHKTATIDYAIVLSGEIYALMDEGEVLLKAGDVLIQRGTNHAWSNRSDEPARLAFVLIDAEPL